MKHDQKSKDTFGISISDGDVDSGSNFSSPNPDHGAYEFSFDQTLRISDPPQNGK